MRHRCKLCRRRPGTEGGHRAEAAPLGDRFNTFRTIVFTLCLTWHSCSHCETLSVMQKSPLAAGRPKGARSYDLVIAKAFGEAVQQARGVRGVSQEALAALAGIERAHVGRIERGEHLPTVVGVFKLAKGLECEVYELLAWVEALLPDGHVDELILQAHNGLSRRRNVLPPKTRQATR